MAPWVSFNGKDCSGCKHFNDRGYCEFTACIIPCTVRATIPEVKPITNGDRIRAMSDEELADWLGVYCNGQTAQEVGKPCVSGMGSCEECWLDWLKQDAKEDK